MSDLGFPLAGLCVPVNNFQRNILSFGESLYFFCSNVPGVMLSTNAMFKSELNTESFSRGKKNKFIHVRLI